MEQALHILRKDARYLRQEIALLLLFAALFVWAEPYAPNDRTIELLLMALAIYMVAALVHAEAIPGADQFWISRPYRWQSLLAAKLIFIVLFIGFPSLAARLAIVFREGFPVGLVLPRLIWSQLTMLVGIGIPVVAIAAMTTSTTSFVFVVLAVVAVAFAAQELVNPFLELLPVVSSLPEGVVWMRNSLVALIAIALSIAILYLQYRRRETLQSRRCALVVAVCTIGIYWSLPMTLAMSTQALFSSEPIDTSTLNVRLQTRATREFGGPQDRTFEDTIQITVPVVLEGVSSAYELRADAITLNARAGDGQTWTWQTMPVQTIRDGDPTVFQAVLELDLPVYQRYLTQPLDLQADVFLTAFRTFDENNVVMTDDPVDIGNGLRCHVGNSDYLLCSSAVQSPRSLIYVKFKATTAPLSRNVSYSPFPTGMALDTIQQHLTPGFPIVQSTAATFIFKQPVAHFRIDGESSRTTFGDSR